MSQPAAAKVQRLGIYGGAFDPPHLAHWAVAQAAITQLGLDALHLLPTGLAWHKRRNLTPSEHRVAMARLAFADLPRARVDIREIQRPGPTYTVQTLREIKQENPQAQLYLVIGADQAQTLPGWHQIEEIKRLAIICVAERDAPAFPLDFQPSSDSDHVLNADFLKISLPLMPHSATEIRQRVALGQALTGLVCEDVASYIHDKHLYLCAQ